MLTRSFFEFAYHKIVLQVKIDYLLYNAELYGFSADHYLTVAEVVTVIPLARSLC